MSESRSSFAPVGEGEEIADGQTLAELANEHGVPLDAVWNADENATLRDSRREPYRVRSGDRVYLPTPSAKETTLAMNSVHRIVVDRAPVPTTRPKCHCVAGETFRFDSAFPRPEVGEGLEGLVDALLDNPRLRIVIFGHADSKGQPEYNKRLSERRAESLRALLTHDVDAWLKLAKREHWGRSRITEILEDLGYDLGETPSERREAIEKFQGEQNIGIDGTVGPQTRRAAFAAYMKSKVREPVPPEVFLKVPTMGCGEFNPIEDQGDGVAHSPNRRGAIFLLDPSQVPKLPCRRGDTKPCLAQIAAGEGEGESFRCPVYRNLAKVCQCQFSPQPDWLDLTLYQEDGRPAAHEEFFVHFADGRRSERYSLDENGHKRLNDVPAGEYWVEFLTDSSHLVTTWEGEQPVDLGGHVFPGVETGQREVLRKPQLPFFAQHRPMSDYSDLERERYGIGNDWTGLREVTHIMYRQLDANDEPISGVQPRRVASIVSCGVQDFSRIVGHDGYLLGIDLGDLASYLEQLQGYAIAVNRPIWGQVYASRIEWIRKCRAEGAQAYPLVWGERDRKLDVDRIDINLDYFTWLVPPAFFPFTKAALDRLGYARDEFSPRGSLAARDMHFEALAKLVAEEKWMVADHFDVTAFPDGVRRPRGVLWKIRNPREADRHRDNPSALRISFGRRITDPVYAKVSGQKPNEAPERPDFRYLIHHTLAELKAHPTGPAADLVRQRARHRLVALHKACHGIVDDDDPNRVRRENEIACRGADAILAAVRESYAAEADEILGELDDEKLPPDADERYRLERRVLALVTTRQHEGAPDDEIVARSMAAISDGARRRTEKRSKELAQVDASDHDAVIRAVGRWAKEAVDFQMVPNDRDMVSTSDVHDLLVRHLTYQVCDKTQWKLDEVVDTLRGIDGTRGESSTRAIDDAIRGRGIECCQAVIEDPNEPEGRKELARAAIAMFEADGMLPPPEPPEPDSDEDAPVPAK